MSQPVFTAKHAGDRLQEEENENKRWWWQEVYRMMLTGIDKNITVIPQTTAAYV